MKTKINYQSVLLNCVTIEERNEAFNNLSPEIQRLEIAWDALNLVLNGHLKPSEGEYWSDALHEINGDSKELQAFLNNEDFYKQNVCTVCERGLMMVAQIRIGNSIDSSDNERSDGDDNNIKGFCLDSFEKMEDEYEASVYNHSYDGRSKAKMANICCNILANGDFNIEDKTDYLID